MDPRPCETRLEAAGVTISFTPSPCDSGLLSAGGRTGREREGEGEGRKEREGARGQIKDVERYKTTVMINTKITGLS